MKYEKNKDKLVYGYIENYNQIFIENQKGNYGDLNIGRDFDDITLDSMFKEDSENMRFMSFKSIENPENVMKIIKEASEKLGSSINEIIE